MHFERIFPAALAKKLALTGLQTGVERLFAEAVRESEEVRVRIRVGIVFLAVACLTLGAWAQKKRVDSKFSYYRTIGIDTVVTDAKGHRMPAHTANKTAFVVLGYHSDNKHVLVQYVANNYSDHDDFRSAVAAAAGTDPLMMVFDPAQVKREVYEPILKAAGFPNADFDRTFVRVP
jgi:hypothetical protein